MSLKGHGEKIIRKPRTILKNADYYKLTPFEAHVSASLERRPNSDNALESVASWQNGEIRTVRKTLDL